MIALTSFSFHAAAQFDGKTQEVVIKTEIYCSHCGHCATCRPQIEDALFAITGVKQAKLHIAEQTIKVTFNPKKTSEKDITAAILSNGYAANGVQPTPEAHGKLEACCQKP
jgi:copper chaperone CopZ